MKSGRSMFSSRVSARDVTLLTSFTALYVVLYALPVFPIIGLPGAAIPAAAIMAPITGMLIGPFLGALSAILGGLISFSIGRFSIVSIFAASITSLYSGLLYTSRRKICIYLYILLLIAFGAYPHIGPFWLYPQLTWFQVIVLLILLSPLSSRAIEMVRALTGYRRDFLQLFTISLVSTMAGQIAGSLAFEIIFWPAFIGEIEAWRGIWSAVTWVYPIERIIISLLATIIGIPLFKALKSAKLI
jgi:predicted membrane protein